MVIRFLFIIQIISSSSSYLYSQIFPKNNAILNYNQVLFFCDEVKNACYYKITLSEFDSTKTLLPNNIKTVVDSNNCVLVKNLVFGNSYQWKTEAYDNSNKLIYNSSSFQFSIQKNEFGDTTLYSVKQFINKQNQYKDGVIWLDKYFCALDRAGNIVWQFPKKGTKEFGPVNMVDLHMCNNGNMLFSNDTAVYYFTKDLKLIWKQNVSDVRKLLKIENIHHVFNQLPNGNFVALAARTEKFKLDKSKPEVYTYDDDIILEFDSVGKLIWYWDFAKHFDTLLIKDYLKVHGSKNLKLSVMIHANSVAYDSTYKYLYLGLRDFNRIIKIDRATKKIIAEYGEKLSVNDKKVFETKLFSRQHDVKPIGQNQIMVFSNGEETEKGKSYVLKLQLPTNKNEQVKKIWELDLDIDAIPGKAIKYGSAQILPNNNILICGGTNGRILEVTANKEPVWDLYLRAKTLRIFNWGLFPQYRAYYNSSLYPYIFNCSKFNADNKSFKLFNDGSEDDSYKIEVYSKENSVKPFETMSLNIITEKSVLVALKNQLAYTVKITSLKSGIIKTYTF